MTSWGPRTPDSATRTTSSGIAGARRAKVVRSTSSVLRSREFTPTTRAPASSARVTSSSVWTSTSAVMPSECTRSTSDVSTVCSSAATMRSTMSAPCARASHTWYGVTTKSLRSTGTSTRARTASRSARLPLNRRCSVSTEIAAAPPFSYSPASSAGSEMDASAPLLGLDRFTSAMTATASSALRRLTHSSAPGTRAARSLSSSSEVVAWRAARSSRTPATMSSSTVIVPPLPVSSRPLPGRSAGVHPQVRADPLTGRYLPS